jgi:hypothetical protein
MNVTKLLYKVVFLIVHYIETCKFFFSAMLRINLVTKYKLCNYKLCYVSILLHMKNVTYNFVQY